MKKGLRDEYQNYFWKNPSDEEIKKTENAFNAMLEYEMDYDNFEYYSSTLKQRIEKRLSTPPEGKIINKKPDLIDYAEKYNTTIGEMKAQRNAVERHIEKNKG